MSLDERGGALVEEFLPMAMSVAHALWKRAPGATELSEFQSLAGLGLVAAAERWPAYCVEHGYDPDRMDYFDAFARRRVRGAIFDAQRSADWLSRSARDRVKAVTSAVTERGTVEEVAAVTGLSHAEVREAHAALDARPWSIDATTEFDVQDRTDVAGTVVETQACQVVGTVFEKLPHEHKAVLALRYFEGLELQAVAREMGLTDAQVSATHAVAVQAMHSSLVEVLAEAVA